MALDDRFFQLDYTHEEIEDLLDKIKNGYVLTKEEYDKLIPKLEDLSTFSGDYNDLINKPNFIEEIRNAIQELNIETSDSVYSKFDAFDSTIKEFIDSGLESKANITHTHEITDIVDLEKKLLNKADFIHNHDNYDEAFKNLENELNRIENGFSVDLDNYVTNDAMAEVLKGKANKTHGHEISDIENLQSSLDDKYNKAETYSQSEINDLIDGKADEVHFHNEHYYTKKESDEKFLTLDDYLETVEDFVGSAQLASAMSTKADVTHTHSEHYTKAEIDKKLTELSVEGETNLDAYAKIEDVTRDLATKSDIGHGHEMSEINGLNEELNKKLEQNAVEELLKNKSDKDHTHGEYMSIDMVGALLDEHKMVIEEGLADELENYVKTDDFELGLLSKADAVHNHDELYYSKQEIDDKIDNTVNDIDLSPYAKIEDVNAALATKAESIHNHDISNINELQNILDNKINKDVAATKAELIEGLSNKSDVGHSHDDNYASIKHEHVVEDITDIKDNFYYKNEIDSALNSKAELEHNHDISEITDLQTELDLKALKDNVYSKDQIDDKMNSKSDVNHNHNDVYYTKQETDEKIDESIGSIDLTPYATIVYVDEELAKKADADHNHDSIYSKLDHVHETDDITDLFDNVHNKEEIKDLLAEKSDIGHGHKIEEIEELQSSLDLKANVEDVYNKTEIDSTVSDLNDKIDTKADADHDHDDDYAALQHKHGVEDITNILDSFYTETEIDDLLAEKSDVGHGHKIPEIEGLSDELSKKADLENVYNKIEINEIVDTINEAIDSKADVEHVHDISEINELQSNLDLKANASDVYNKASIDSIVGELNEAIDGKADVEHGHDIAAIEGLQDTLDSKADKEDTYTKDDIDNTVKELEEAINSKSDAEHDHDEVYAALQHKHIVEEITDLFDNVHTKEEIKNLLAEKSDSDHNHDSIYSKLDHVHLAENITDLYNNIYNKTEVDEIVDTVNEAINGKADVKHGHDMSVITGLEEALALKASIEEMNKKASKEELETGLLTKSDESHKHDDIYAPLIHNHDDLYYTETEINSLLEKAIDDARIISVAEANAHSDEAIANLVDSAPDAMNTLNELAQAINDHQEVYDAYVETVTKSLSSKSDVGHDHNTIYYTKQEVDNKVFEGIDGIDFTTYTLKTEMNTALAAKAELKHTHEAVDITNLQEILDAKADSMNAATKEEFEALESLVAGKASVDHDHNNDYYTKTQIDENITNKLNSIDHSAYALKTEVEEALGSKSDADHKHEGVYLEKNEVENLIGDAIAGADLPSYATKDLLDTELAKKASVNHTHDQSEIEDLITTLESKVDDTQLDLYTTKVQVKDALATKSDASHNHDDKYSEIDHRHDVTTLTGMYTNFYTKTQVENRLAEKADSVHSHEIERIYNLQSSLDAKANVSDVYTKNEVDSALALKLDSSYKQEIDAAIDLKLDKADISTITNEQIDQIMLDVFDTDL